MGLSSAFQIGRSALSTSQIALQIAGNNLANAATPGYSRQALGLTPVAGDGTFSGSQIGRGVGIRAIRRQVDEALNARLASSISDQAASDQRLAILSQLETVLNELTENDLSSELSSFNAAWSELSSGNSSNSLVVEQADRLAGSISRLQNELSSQRLQLDTQLDAAVTAADGLIREVARLNAAITESEGAGTQANPLRDQRDEAIRELSALMDVTPIEQPSGAVDLLVGSTPIILGSTVQNLEVRRESRGDSIRIDVALADSGDRLPVRSGQIGALLDGRSAEIDQTLDKLDTLASTLIFQANRIHSTGTNQPGLTGVGGTLSIATADRSLALNDPANTSLSRLPFAAENGGFFINVTDEATGTTSITRIDVDLDGIDSSGAPGVTDDTSAQDIVDAINAVSGVSASFAPDGTIRIDAEAGQTFAFSDDSSGALAVLGVNTFFQGSDAQDIAVRSAIVDNPTLLAVGRLDENNNFVDNGTALALSGVMEQSLNSLDGQSLSGFWIDSVQALAVRTDAAISDSESAAIVREGLDAQRLSLSGVNVDEEAIDLVTYQRQFQGAARLIDTVNSLLDELIAII